MKCPLAEKGCGGCRELTRMYGDILREKDAAFRALFPDALPILGMAEPRAYRNKVLRTFANGKSGLYHGIYRAGTHQVISVRRCLMENERANEIANIEMCIRDRACGAQRRLPACPPDENRPCRREYRCLSWRAAAGNRQRR